MTGFQRPPSDVEASLLALERRRCAAICAGDLKELDAMMSGTLTYVHKSGSVEDKSAYLNGLTTLREFKAVERENLSVRVSGNVAVMTGIQRVVLRRRDGGDFFELKVFATQVWVKSGDTWRMEVYHSTGI